MWSLPSAARLCADCGPHRVPGSGRGVKWAGPEDGRGRGQRTAGAGPEDGRGRSAPPVPWCSARTLSPERGLLSLTVMQGCTSLKARRNDSYRAVWGEVTEAQAGKHEKEKKEKVRRFQRRGLSGHGVGAGAAGAAGFPLP